jgi:NADP-reducing hydrogenase subunit HndB
MAKMKIEDLKKIKEAKRGTVNLRDGDYRVKITVHLGTCGIASGARNLMNFLLDRIEKSGAEDIILTSSGCPGLCNQEPMITVVVREQPPVKYVLLDEEKVARIFEEHVMNGKPVADYALAIGSETAY